MITTKRRTEGNDRKVARDPKPLRDQTRTPHHRPLLRFPTSICCRCRGFASASGKGVGLREGEGLGDPCHWEMYSPYGHGATGHGDSPSSSIVAAPEAARPRRESREAASSFQPGCSGQGGGHGGRCTNVTHAGRQEGKAGARRRGKGRAQGQQRRAQDGEKQLSRHCPSETRETTLRILL